MEIDKGDIVRTLRSRGDDSGADRAQEELPQRVDSDEHADLLTQLGISPLDLGSRTLSGDGEGDLGEGGGIGGDLGGRLNEHEH